MAAVVSASITVVLITAACAQTLRGTPQREVHLPQYGTDYPVAPGQRGSCAMYGCTVQWGIEEGEAFVLLNDACSLGMMPPSGTEFGVQRL